MFHRIIKHLPQSSPTANPTGNAPLSSRPLHQKPTQLTPPQQPSANQSALKQPDPYPRLAYRLAMAYLMGWSQAGLHEGSSNQPLDRQSAATSGFSLLESLMAVVVVTVLLVGIAPMIALSTATRVNARRVDQAVQAARTYSDAVRSGIIGTPAIYQYFPCPSQTATIPCPVGTGTNAYFFDTVGAPGAAGTTNSRGVSVPAGISIADLFNPVKFPGVTIDTNGNGFSTTDPQDLVVMPIRSTGANSYQDLDSQGFVLVLRVYRADAFNSAKTGLSSFVNTLRRGDEPECTNTILTGSAGSRACPLVQVRYEVFPSTITYDSLKTRL